MVEDAQEEKLVYIILGYIISGLIAAFAPIAGVFVGKFSVVPAVRILYLIALL